MPRQSVATKPRRSKKEETTETVTEEPTVSDTTEKKKRFVPTKESVEQEFDELLVLVDKEIDSIRESSNKCKGVKFLKTLNKRLKTLRSHTLRVTKQKQTTRRTGNNNSGLLKPVRISKELAEFTGWDVNQPKSRVDVTKYICNYIKEKDLQNPEDRRQILVDKDRKLKNVLKYTDKEKPLTYFRLQSCLKTHFSKLEDEAPQAPTETVEEKPVEEKPKRRRRK